MRGTFQKAHVIFTSHKHIGVICIKEHIIKRTCSNISVLSALEMNSKIILFKFFFACFSSTICSVYLFSRLDPSLCRKKLFEGAKQRGGIDTWHLCYLALIHMFLISLQENWSFNYTFNIHLTDHNYHFSHNLIWIACTRCDNIGVAVSESV